MDQQARNEGLQQDGPAPDRVTSGVVLGFLSFAAFSFSDASVKAIEGALPAYESSFFGALFAFLAMPFLMRPGDRWTDIFATGSRALWLLRFVAYPLGVIGSVIAFTHLPMAEAFALIFLQPAFVTLMSMTFLRERIGIRRWAAVIIGFIGVLIVLRPGLRPLEIGHLGALVAGLGGAVVVITFRAAGPEEKRISLFGAGILGTVVICGLLMVPGFRMPSALQWGFLASYGLLAALANILLMAAAFRAPAVALGPTQYSQMLWAIVLGYLFFGDGVDLPMLVGIALIIGSGLLTLLRERTRGTPLPPPVATGRPASSVALTPEQDD
ncbi:DMT family transporter [Roseomonas sp. HJA6]|uniref:DMT family transporter n=1 Tax=Roseomonas alba TaxID=2846776 RepID=A0ABS7AF52_9PROT|nr:DMT family transporter [Neoroseomonas alba]MBW6400936.1 DMT family transporter [Neoroseomonas alba]